MMIIGSQIQLTKNSIYNEVKTEWSSPRFLVLIFIVITTAEQLLRSQLHIFLLMDETLIK